MKSPSIESLRGLLQDSREWVVLGKIVAIAPATDRSVMRLKVSSMTMESPPREIIARQGWAGVGANSGLYGPAQVGDITILVLPEGNEELAVAVCRLSTSEDVIPQQVIDGDTMIKSVDQLKLHLASLTRINIGLGDYAAQPTENLVLGQVFKQMMIDVLNTCISLCNTASTHTHTDSMGVRTTVPNQAADFVDLAGDYSTIKASPVQDENVLSDLAFTEKG